MATHVVPNSVMNQCDEQTSVVKLDIRRQLLRRAERLPDPDRTVLRTVLMGKASFRDLEGLLGLSAGQICRRVKTIQRRLRHPVTIATCDLARAERDLTERQQRVALQHFLLGKAPRTVARECNFPYRGVVADIAFVHGWAKGVAHDMRRALDDLKRDLEAVEQFA